MKSLQSILHELLEQLPARQRDQIHSFQALLDWPEIVGERIAAVTEPLKLERSVLLIQVANAVWKSELQFMKAELLNQINAKTGLKLKDLKFV